MNYLLELETMFDFESLPIDAIDLTPNQIDRAIALSQSAPEEEQWQIYLNALALFGFEQWLSERASDLNLDSSDCSLLQPEFASLPDAICNLRVGRLNLCLIATGSLTDTVIPVPRITLPQDTGSSIDLPDFYVVVEVLEEQDYVRVQSYLRRDRLQGALSNRLVQIQSTAGTADQLVDWLPASWFEPDPDALLLYLRALEPIALDQTEVEPLMQPSIAPSLTPSLNLTQRALNVGLWLRNQLDELAQELAWTLLPPLTPSLGMRSAVEELEEVVAALQQQGVIIPAQARAAYQDLSEGIDTVRLYVVAWSLPLSGNVPEWTLLLILGGRLGSTLPAGIGLQVRDQTQLLIDRTLNPDSSDAYLYGRVIGAWSEEFFATIGFPNGAAVTLPAFTFHLDSPL